MTAATERPKTEHPETDGPTFTIGRVAAVLVILALMGMWGYAFSPFAPREFAGRLEERSIAAAAEATCRPMADFVAAQPSAAAARTTQERAAQLRPGTAQVITMIDALEELRPSGPDGEKWDRWIADWETYIADRERHETALDRGEDRQFQITTDEGKAVTARMNNFADGNDMVSCRTPDDLVSL